MSDSFDVVVAKEKHDRVIQEAERIRDGLTSDIINYYRNSPTTEDEEREQQRGIQKYLETAQDDIRNALNKLR